MIRIIFWAVLLIGLASGAIWLNNNPGTIQVEWMGYEISAPILVMVIAVFALLLGTIMLVSLVARLFNIPLTYRMKSQKKNHERGLEAVTMAITSLAISDDSTASKYTKKAEKFLGQSPLTQLLNAQISYRSGDALGTTKELESMLEHKPTGFLAARALANLAIKDGKTDEALEYAERARRIEPSNTPCNLMLLNLYIQKERWAEAENVINQGKSRKAFSRERAKYLLALVYATKAAGHEAQNQTQKALLLREQSFKNAPAFTDNSVKLAEHYGRTDQLKKSLSTLGRAWREKPHPSLALTALDLIMSEPEKKQGKLMASFVKSQPKHLESHLALAEFSIRSSKWSDAETHAKQALELAKQSRIYSVLAVIASKQGKESLASNHMQKAASADANPAWTCGTCGNRTGEWHLNCGSCNSFDAITWKTEALTSATILDMRITDEPVLNIAAN